MTALPDSRVPGLLLLHGVGDSGACWGPFVDRLRAADGGRLAGLQVATPNAPAHGGDRAAIGRTISAPDQLAVAVGHAQDLVARSGGPIVVGGHSMGSAVALALAAVRPELTVALWLEDPPFMSSAAENDAEDPDRLVDVTEFSQWFEALGALPLEQVVAMARADHPTWDEAEYEPWARAKQQVDTDAFAAPVSWIGARWAEHARSISVPTVVVAGDPARGGIVHPTAAAELAALPGWSVHHVATGHDARRDAPDEVVALLAGLIRSVAT